MTTPERIYLEYAPDATSLETLLQVQDQARQAYGGELVPATELHLTALHFGITNQIFGDVRKVVPALDRNVFMRETSLFIDRAGSHMPPSLDVELYDYRRYGHDHSILVALVKKTRQLMDAQLAMAHELQQMLGRLGVADATDFIRSNKSLWATLDYEPHISLVKDAGYAAELPKVQERLHLTAVPINYDLAHERFT